MGYACAIYLYITIGVLRRGEKMSKDGRHSITENADDELDFSE